MKGEVLGAHRILGAVLIGTSAGFLFLGCGGSGSGSNAPPATAASPAMPYPGSKALPASQPGLYLRQASGNLRIQDTASTPVYQAYFHIPIAFAGQAPFLFTLESSTLVDYRFVRVSPPNVIVAARLKAGPTILNWNAWVVVKADDFSGVPQSLPMSSLASLPDQVKPWLQSSDCVQVGNTFVQSKAAAAANGAQDLMVLAGNVANACGAIPYQFGHTPVAFDAFYALNWGNSCTGHAHAGAAMLRSHGIPARILMNMPSWDQAGMYDQHWIIDYYLPTYGWARMETLAGQNLPSSQDELVTFVCAPEDEFPVFLPCGIEGYWHTSDPSLPVWDPVWHLAHTASDIGAVPTSGAAADQAVAAAAQVFSDEVDRRGLAYGTSQQAALDAALAGQKAALASLQAGDATGFVTNLQSASAAYEKIALPPPSTIFSEDFENGAVGWTHGGTQDSWALSMPAAGSRPGSAHSGSHCYGTGFAGSYPANADSWLLSPPFDLRSLSAATLSFWLYNWVYDVQEGQIGDPLWVEATTNGGLTFQPICSQMGGVNEDPAIPSVGGWTRLYLDLAPLLGNASVQVRFHFRSGAGNGTGLPGSYVDDVQVTGRPQ